MTRLDMLMRLLLWIRVLVILVIKLRSVFLVFRLLVWRRRALISWQMIRFAASRRRILLILLFLLLLKCSEFGPVFGGLC